MDISCRGNISHVALCFTGSGGSHQQECLRQVSVSSDTVHREPLFHSATAEDGSNLHGELLQEFFFVCLFFWFFLLYQCKDSLAVSTTLNLRQKCLPRVYSRLKGRKFLSFFEDFSASARNKMQEFAGNDKSVRVHCALTSIVILGIWRPQF